MTAKSMLDTFTCGVEFKDLTEEGEFVGYASVFDVVDATADVIVKGAFKKSLKKKLNNIKMLFQHDPSQPIGVWTEMREDDTGLFVKGRLLTKLNKAQEVMELMKVKAIDGLSIGFRTIEHAYERVSKDGVENMVRKLKQVDLWEVSVVTFPANTDARISQVKGEWQLRDVESILREAGAPNQFAKLVAKYGYDVAVKKLADGQREAASGLSDVAAMLRQGIATIGTAP